GGFLFSGSLQMKTVMGSKKTVRRDWVVIDVKDKVLGRAATTIASVLRGKHKPIFTPHADCGDFVVVINADKVRLTGKKWKDKKYIHHTMYPGGLVVNVRTLNDYYGRETSKMTLKQPLEVVEQLNKVDIAVIVCGGGLSGQAGAIRHGISRALTKLNPEYRPPLKKAGFLTRDA